MRFWSVRRLHATSVARQSDPDITFANDNQPEQGDAVAITQSHLECRAVDKNRVAAMGRAEQVVEIFGMRLTLTAFERR